MSSSTVDEARGEADFLEAWNAGPNGSHGHLDDLRRDSPTLVQQCRLVGRRRDAGLKDRRVVAGASNLLPTDRVEMDVLACTDQEVRAPHESTGRDVARRSRDPRGADLPRRSRSAGHLRTRVRSLGSRRSSHLEWRASSRRPGRRRGAARRPNGRAGTRVVVMTGSRATA